MKKLAKKKDFLPGFKAKRNKFEDERTTITPDGKMKSKPDLKQNLDKRLNYSTPPRSKSNQV